MARLAKRLNIPPSIVSTIGKLDLVVKSQLDSMGSTPSTREVVLAENTKPVELGKTMFLALLTTTLVVTRSHLACVVRAPVADHTKRPRPTVGKFIPTVNHGHRALPTLVAVVLFMGGHLGNMAMPKGYVKTILEKVRRTLDSRRSLRQGKPDEQSQNMCFRVTKRVFVTMLVSSL